MASITRNLIVVAISLAVILLLFFSGAAAATVVGDRIGWTTNTYSQVQGFSTTEASGSFASTGGYPAILAIQIL
jgi:hypothetical protein